MRLALPTLAAAGAALLLAGCFGPPTVTPDPTPTSLPPSAEIPTVTVEEPAPAAWMALFRYEGRITVGTGLPGVGYLSPTGSQDPHVFAFSVTEGATALVAELRWDSPMHDLDLELASPGCDTTTGAGTCFWIQGGNPGAGDSPVRFVLEDAAVLAPGDWTLYVWAKDALNTAFDGAVSVFYGLGPSDDYTAMAP